MGITYSDAEARVCRRLEANLAISEQWAQKVRDRLADELDRHVELSYDTMRGWGVHARNPQLPFDTGVTAYCTVTDDGRRPLEFHPLVCLERSGAGPGRRDRLHAAQLASRPEGLLMAAAIPLQVTHADISVAVLSREYGTTRVRELAEELERTQRPNRARLTIRWRRIVPVPALRDAWCVSCGRPWMCPHARMAELVLNPLA
ncbi:hypothetical protein [Actinopolymorpha alba]|uniref:hypothetical protein n=1 Tax=Actinopolymorpha alba TaxID=533267 RepID=UPI0003793ED0|nr:hypothetical protein [Actinopolymorpha alba]